MKKIYNLGDVVRVVNRGGCYTTYKTAFSYFNILHLAKKSPMRYELEPPYDFDKTNWVIVGKAIHPTSKTFIYCLKNMRGERILSGDNYFILRPNVTTNYTKKLKEKNMVYKINEIGW